MLLLLSSTYCILLLHSLHLLKSAAANRTHNMASSFLKYSVLLQKYRTPLLIASCGGVFAANMFYQVFPDMSYRQLYQAWYQGEPVTLSEKLQDVFQQVCVCVEVLFVLFFFSLFSPKATFNGSFYKLNYISTI